MSSNLKLARDKENKKLEVQLYSNIVVNIKGSAEVTGEGNALVSRIAIGTTLKFKWDHHITKSRYESYIFKLTQLNLGTQAAVDGELLTLLSIKSSIIDPMNYLKGWQQPSNATQRGTPHCNWTGVWCNSKGLVETLDISNMNLSGRVSDHVQSLSSLSYFNISSNNFASLFPISLSNLTSLKSFDVSQNYFTGSFPIGLGRAAGLQYINASSNDFMGYIPEDIGNATLLESLDFRGSYFISIPRSFKNLQKLKFIGLSGNNFTGKIPGYLGELSSLETLILGYNEFEGEIPAEFGNLTNLQYLDLAVGSLSGQIPFELGKLKKLTTIYLYHNSFTGKIPPHLGNITSLAFLDLSDNQISGEIPGELANLESLQLLNLMTNNLTGPIPEKLGELKNLQVLELWKNSLKGPLPANLGKISPLQWLDVSSNSLSGEIPPGLCSTGNLTKLILFNNSFSGSIPSGLSNCSSLVRVRIQNNLISGTIPVGFGSLPSLQRLELANNNLTGQVPKDITLSTSLSFIDVSWNHLESSLPSEILSVPTLQTFIASYNNFDSDIPEEFQDCPSLSVLDLSNTHISGKIPESIASCKKLVNLNLRNNHLTGEIPISITNMPTLSILDLSNNSLTGRIPENFGSSPALEMLNLSYNKLEGPVPSSGILMTMNRNDLIGNAGLCGGVLPPCSQSFVDTNYQHGRSHIRHVIIGFLIGISVILSLGAAFFVGRCLYKRWYLCNNFIHDWLKQTNEDWPWRLVAFQRISLTSSDILTCIKESNVIGMGGTGIVYKAEINRPHVTVAVKKLWRSATDIEDGNNILREVELLGRLRHRNIVRLLGYVHNERDVMMVDEKIDIYSYGVVLLELITGKMPLDPSFEESVEIVEWIRKKRCKNALEEALDPTIAGQCKHVQEEMLLVLRIALLCTAKLPKERPSMRDIITMLGEAKPRRKSICHSRGQESSMDKPIFTTSPVVNLL
ncbi:unnamed protein product [Lupinus luteus]|uniref:Protein kinase domain-containing protein n=1 Tax=Lupinus luteus TaxID=3873 RepID=A0AAV1VSS3_LUPLU